MVAQDVLTILPNYNPVILPQLNLSNYLLDALNAPEHSTALATTSNPPYIHAHKTLTKTHQ